MSEDASGVWEAVRRTLGRLIGSARVHGLPPERLTSTAQVSASEALSGPPCHAGVRERDWRPAARVIADLLPQADPGAGGVDLANVPTVIGMNAALRPAALETFRSPPLPASCTMHRLDAGDARKLSAAVHGAAARPAVGAVRSVDARIAAPNGWRLPMDPPVLPHTARVLRFGRRPPAGDEWRLGGVRVRSGLTVIADVPMSRSRAPVSAEASLAARRRLAEMAGIALDDIVLLGVFPQVPVAAVRRLALEEGGGALSLWLKPEALAHAAAGKSPRLATLVLGRQRSTGRMVQTVA